LEELVAPVDPPKLMYSLAFETLILGFLLVAGGLWLGALGNAMGIVSVCGASVLMMLKIRNVSTRVTLASAKGRVVVSVEEFADSAAVISYVESHIPANIRSD
jgi:hypothetical protein